MNTMSTTLTLKEEYHNCFALLTLTSYITSTSHYYLNLNFMNLDFFCFTLLHINVIFKLLFFVDSVFFLFLTIF